MTLLYSIEQDLSGQQNMKRDELLAEACSEDGIPRLRFYSWTPWTLSLGYNQKDGRIDKDELQRRGYGFVRRPTGGRAVFHAEEITYGIAMPTGGEGIHATYARISQALKHGFEALGAHGIEFSRSTPNFKEHYDQLESEGCFSASALNELVWDGKKLVGSAQRRYNEVLLQHGSILLDEAHLEIADLLTLSPEMRTNFRQKLKERTATLSEILPDGLPPFEHIAQALLGGFSSILNLEPQREDEITNSVRNNYSPTGTI